MLDALLAPFRELLADIERQAADRRRLSASDPAADYLAFFARELRQRIEQAGARTAFLTPEEYAKLPHVSVSPQAVRTWCRNGKLPGAQHTEHGWRIPREARRTRDLPTCHTLRKVG